MLEDELPAIAGSPGQPWHVQLFQARATSAQIARQKYDKKKKQ